MDAVEKHLIPLVYSRGNHDLAEELEAIKTATGPRRVELSRALVSRFCEFQNDLSNHGDFYAQMGVSSELTAFIFSGLRSWAGGGSIESTVSVDAKPGRPPQTHRNRGLFEDVRRRVTAGWDVHAACYATADALQLGDVAGLEPKVLSPSSIRRIYYSVMSAGGGEESRNSDISADADQAIVLDPLDEQTVSLASDGQWNATKKVLRQIYQSCDHIISNRYLMMIARMTGLNLDVLIFHKTCLEKIIDGQSPNEVYSYSSKE